MEPVLDITDDERRCGSISPEKLDHCRDLLDEHGYLVLPNAVSSAPLEKLNDFLNDEWAAFNQSKDKWIGGGRHIGHVQLMPPATPEYLLKEALLNDIFFQITSHILGPDVVNVVYSGHTNLPGSTNQHFHSDTEPVGMESLIINIPLIDVDESNGSLELIAGSHKQPHSFRSIEAMEMQGHGIRINSAIGDAVIRYPTLLHRGAANPSSMPRHMLSMWHAPRGTSVEVMTPPFPVAPACKDMIGDGVERQKCHFEERRLNTFCPNYFAPNVAGLIKEMAFLHTPGLFSLVKRMQR